MKKILLLLLFTVMTFGISIIISTITTEVKAKNVKPTEYVPNQKTPTKIAEVNGIMVVNKQNGVPNGYTGHKKSEEATKHLNSMIKSAKKEGYNLESFSGFRTVERQKVLYDSYVKKSSKAEADKYSARPNYSEHHTALTHDMREVGETKPFDDSAKNKKSMKWLSKNMYKYGFIVRYPENSEDKTGYIPEFWHIRYIGVEHATAMKEKKIVVLEEYLGIKPGEVINGSVTNKDSESAKASSSKGDKKDDKKDEKETTESTTSNENVSSVGGTYKWFNPFIKEKGATLNSVTGMDTRENVLPNELTHTIDVFTKRFVMVANFMMIGISMILIVILALQISFVALMVRGNDMMEKMESKLFGKNTSSSHYIKIIITNSITVTIMIAMTLSMFFADIQAKLYFGIATFIGFIL